MKLVLASASERRQALLSQMGYRFEVVPAEVPEQVPAGIPPERGAEVLAERKAAAVASRLSDALVIGADTVVALGNEIIGKPKDRADAVRILRRLRGTTQKVITGLCLIDARTQRRTIAHESSLVRMAHISDAQIEQYVAAGHSDGKAGAYAVQEPTDPFVEVIEGSFNNVVGLPTELLSSLLLAAGIEP